MDDLKNLHPETLLVHGGTLRSQFGETSEALFLNSGFVYATAEDAEARFKGEADGYVYSRYANPTVAMFEKRMALLEGSEAARATASGMAAVTGSLLSHLRAGDHVVASKALFGACRYIIEEFLPRFGVASTLIDGRDLNAWRGAIRDNTRALFCETPANPTLALVDLAAVSAIAREAGALFIVDNVFATPMLQRPMAHGVDVVVYSATKHIDGQGRCLGGVICASAEFAEAHLKEYMRQTGPSLSPFNAWVMLKGLETLPLRVARQSASASQIADALASHPRVAAVVYPGRADHPQAEIARKQMTDGGPILAFHLRAGREEAFRFLNALRLIRISNNLGDAKSLITHPATTTHQRLTAGAQAELGITPGTVRLSVGLEHPGDLIADLDRALEASHARIAAE